MNQRGRLITMQATERTPDHLRRHDGRTVVIPEGEDIPPNVHGRLADVPGVLVDQDLWHIESSPAPTADQHSFPDPSVWRTSVLAAVPPLATAVPPPPPPPGGWPKPPGLAEQEIRRAALDSAVKLLAPTLATMAAGFRAADLGETGGGALTLAERFAAFIRDGRLVEARAEREGL